MSASAGMKRVVSSRYQWLKLGSAIEEFVLGLRSPQVSSSATAAADQASQAAGGSLGSAIEKAKQAYNSQLTSVMYIAGAAMAPALNKAGMRDKDALEKLVIRLIPRPSTRNIFVGDVVALNSPLGPGPNDTSHVLVRRVAAMEGDEMVSTSSSSADDDDTAFSIKRGHCWVLADNEQMKSSEVIDSRSFGEVPIENIIGRVIYAGSSPNDHGPVANNSLSEEEDRAVLEAEVDVEELFKDTGRS